MAPALTRQTHLEHISNESRFTESQTAAIRALSFEPRMHYSAGLAPVDGATTTDAVWTMLLARIELN